MSWRWLLIAGLLASPALLRAQPAGAGYLLVPAPNGQVQAIPYVPRAGDIALFDHDNRFFHLMFKLARTLPPTHVAMVIDGPDGKPALFELAGPQVRTARTGILDVGERFSTFPGTVMVRRIRCPLTPEKSGNLTRFAQSQLGKRFSLARIVLLGTPFSPRWGLRQKLFGRTPTNRHRWFCSELLVAGLAVAGIIEGDHLPANAALPYDFLADDRLNLSGQYHLPLLWAPGPPLGALTPPAAPAAGGPCAGRPAWATGRPPAPWPAAPPAPPAPRTAPGS